MIKRNRQKDYDTVSRSRSRRANEALVNENHERARAVVARAEPTNGEPETSTAIVDGKLTLLKHGHAVSFAALFVFTIILYARPAEFYPSPWTNSLALIVGIITLALFIATQFSLEGSFTARPKEVKLVALFMLMGLLSIPLAIDPLAAWADFSGTFIRGILIFIVIVNVVRTERRLKALLFLAIATAIWLSVGAVNDYRLGLMTIEGYRAAGRGTGIFGNTNDMALHLVTMLPISIALFFGSRGVMKSVHAVCAAVMIFGILLSYSRGAFLGMIVVFIFFAFKIGKRSRFEIAIIILAVAAAIVLLSPSGYGDRLLSILDPSLDASGSADSRRGELFRSIYVALRHPLLGIGMGNYQPNMSFRGLVTHNSYTQVAAEMGMAALVFYTMFIVSPLRKLSTIVRETFLARNKSHFYYLALGLQASLLVYMVSSFFLSIAYAWNVFYLVGYAVCLRRMNESDTGKFVVVEKRKDRKKDKFGRASAIESERQTATA